MFFLCLLTKYKIRAFFPNLRQVALQESPHLPDMTLSRDALAPRYVAVVGAAVVGAATVAGAGSSLRLARRRRRPACGLRRACGYSTGIEQQQAAIRFWIYIRGLEASIASRQITHEEQHEQWFADVNPHRCGLNHLGIPGGPARARRMAVAVNASRSSLVPARRWTALIWFRTEPTLEAPARTAACVELRRLSTTGLEALLGPQRPVWTTREVLPGHPTVSRTPLPARPIARAFLRAKGASARVDRSGSRHAPQPRALSRTEDLDVGPIACRQRHVRDTRIVEVWRGRQCRWFEADALAVRHR